MNVFVVGGAVRDALMGQSVNDRDWVVVGSTPEAMTAQGYVPVGKDFPVFLHPKSREEYALARTERKTARGYKGFAVQAAPDVTLEEDLARRDLTINAIALPAEALQADGGSSGVPFPLTQQHVADGLGLPLPAALPRAMAERFQREHGLHHEPVLLRPRDDLRDRDRERHLLRLAHRPPPFARNARCASTCRCACISESTRTAFVVASSHVAPLAVAVPELEDPNAVELKVRVASNTCAPSAVSASVGWDPS